MFDQRVEDTADAEGGLDNIGHELPDVLCPLGPLDGEKILADFNLAIRNAGNIDDGLAGLLQLLLKLATLLLGSGDDGSLNGFAILLVMRTELLLVNDGLPLLDDLRGLQPGTHDQWCASLLGMHGQIIGASVSAANAFDPAGRGQELRVPAVGSIVSHLISHVLTETDLGHIDTDLLQE